MARVVPLWQPWASLVIVGAKKIETRPNPAPSTIVGQRVGIHATLTPAHLWLVKSDPEFARALKDIDLPLGALLGTVVVTGSEPITPSFARALQPKEFAFGNYAVGRYAWTLEDPRPLPAPVPWKGKQGIMIVPNEVLGLPADAQEGLL